MEVISEIPDEILETDLRRKVVVFLGSGLSQRMSCCRWDRFADRSLQQPVGLGIIDEPQSFKGLLKW
jgi:hypothetical protein